MLETYALLIRKAIPQRVDWQSYLAKSDGRNLRPRPRASLHRLRVYQEAFAILATWIVPLAWSTVPVTVAFSPTNCSAFF